MVCNILIGGEAGQGIDTLAKIIEKTLKRNGFYVFSIKDYMSRVRGGHNFIQVRFSDKRLYSHSDILDYILALNDETITIHKDRLSAGGRIISDSSVEINDNKIFSYQLKKKAEEAGNVKSFGSIAMGILFKLEGLDIEGSFDVIKESFEREDIADINIRALKIGFDMVDSEKKIFSGQKDKNIIINGNEATALGVLASDCRFYSAYPMTPSTGIMNYLASKMKDSGVVVEQAEDEIAAINMAIGASYAGVRSMTGTSGGGFSLMIEGLGLSSMLEIPLVIAVVQRPGPATGLPTRTEQGDLKFVINASQGEFPRMVIALRDPEDAFYQTIRAFNIADKYRIPVILLGDQYLADYNATMKPFDFNRIEIERYLNTEEVSNEDEYMTYKLNETGISPRIIPSVIPGMCVRVDSDEHDEWGHITESSMVRVLMTQKRMGKMKSIINDLEEPLYFGERDADTVFIAWGSTYGPLKEAVEILNINQIDKKYAAIVFGDIWPLPRKKLEEISYKAKTLICIEQNYTGQLASIIREQTGIHIKNLLLKYDGRPISPEEIVSRTIKEVV